jgi:hypothetical protein
MPMAKNNRQHSLDVGIDGSVLTATIGVAIFKN